MLLFGQSVLFHCHARRPLDAHDLVMDVGMSTPSLNASHHGLNDNGGLKLSIVDKMKDPRARFE
jgi:hypothetical protein